MMVLASINRPWPRLARATRFTVEVLVAAATAQACEAGKTQRKPQRHNRSMKGLASSRLLSGIGVTMADRPEGTVPAGRTPAAIVPSG